LGRVDIIIKQQLMTDICPHELFGEEAVVFKGRADKLFFIANHNSPEISVRPSNAKQIALRMAASLSYERQAFLAAYLKFRFAFPERASQMIEQTADVERELLVQMLANKEAYEVYHPYPVSVPALYDAMHPYCV
jgi:hypothetical protein